MFSTTFKEDLIFLIGKSKVWRHLHVLPSCPMPNTEIPGYNSYRVLSNSVVTQQDKTIIFDC
jgi:hypothetical protein